jgi:hypothetical protein
MEYAIQLELVVKKIARSHESVIVFNLMPIKAKKGILSLEIADLQGTIDFGGDTGATVYQCQLNFG